ncbi:hypothetical protein [Streptomyces niveus]|uniref:hypothetical protein n=1 Tax=Streptomyces niveus TaxID=193462 RepID=UPI00339EAB3B
MATPSMIIETARQLTADEVAALGAHVREHGLSDLPFGARVLPVTHGDSTVSSGGEDDSGGVTLRAARGDRSAWRGQE